MIFNISHNVVIPRSTNERRKQIRLLPTAWRAGFLEFVMGVGVGGEVKENPSQIIPFLI